MQLLIGVMVLRRIAFNHINGADMAKNENNQRTIDKEQKREAQRVLNRVARESEQVGTSSMARTADKVRDHFLAEEAPRDDKVEIWGKRIGRGLGAIVFIGLVIYLIKTYVFVN